MAVDGRAVVFGDDGTWPLNIKSVRLVFESLEGCGCNAACSLEVVGNIYEPDCTPNWPTTSNTEELKGCDGKEYGVMWKPGVCGDQAANVPLRLCDGTILGMLYPASIPGKATKPVRLGCDEDAVIVGYALNDISPSYYSSGGCTSRPGQQRTAWFDVNGGQTRRIGGFAGRYKVFATLLTGSNVMLAEGPVL